MFVTQVHDKEISEEEKFGYLLEMVSPKVRDKIANLKPGAMGYKIAWERLEKEFGQTKRVINAHMRQIINIPTVRGSNYIKMQEFYETVSKNHNALLTLGEANMLRGFVMATLDKLPQVKPDYQTIRFHNCEKTRHKGAQKVVRTHERQGVLHADWRRVPNPHHNRRQYLLPHKDRRSIQRKTRGTYRGGNDLWMGNPRR